LKGNTLKQINDELNTVFGEFATYFITAKFCPAEFKRGHTSFVENERSGRPKTTTTDDNAVLVPQNGSTQQAHSERKTLFTPKESNCEILNQDLRVGHTQLVSGTDFQISANFKRNRRRFELEKFSSFRCRFTKSGLIFIMIIIK
jgi:hypothetical protein